MKKSALSLGVLMVASSCFATDPVSDEQKKVGEQHITGFIIDALRKCPENKWCKYFPGSCACDPYLKNTVLSQNIRSSDDGFVHVEVRTHIGLDENSNISPNHFYFGVYVKGLEEIKRFEKMIGVDENGKAEDDNTVCYIVPFPCSHLSSGGGTFYLSDNGVPCGIYFGKTTMERQEFLERRNEKK